MLRSNVDRELGADAAVEAGGGSVSLPLTTAMPRHYFDAAKMKKLLRHHELVPAILTIPGL